MTLWTAVWTKIKELVNRVIGNNTIQSKLDIVPIVSSKMSTAIDLWSKMYTDESPWLHKATLTEPVNVVSLGLAATIASEKARTATIEMRSEITAPVENDTDNLNATADDVTKTFTATQKAPKTNERATYLNEQYQKKLLTRIKTQLEYGIAKGGLIIKPYLVFPEGDTTLSPEFTFDFIQADSFYPISFDSSGNITECVFMQHKQDKNIIYTRLEHHILMGTTAVVRNYAFKVANSSATADSSLSISDLGKEIPLTEVAEWKDLQAEVTIKNVRKLLFGYFKMPDANTIDPKSPLGVSGFSRAVANIEEADKQYSRLLWEYEGGELAVDIDRDALTSVQDASGKIYDRPTMLQERLYRRVDLGEANTFIPYAPALRDSSYIHGLNTILMRVEDQCAISRGTLSDPTTEARTATELRVLKQRTYIANHHIQEALQRALEDTVYAMDVYCTLYDVIGDTADIDVGNTDVGKYEISFEWDDSILVDVDEELNKRLALMKEGITSKVELRMWYYGETESQAREALKQIEQESLGEAEQDIDNQEQDTDNQGNEYQKQSANEMVNKQLDKQMNELLHRGE